MDYTMISILIYSLYYYGLDNGLRTLIFLQLKPCQFQSELFPRYDRRPTSGDHDRNYTVSMRHLACAVAVTLLIYLSAFYNNTSPLHTTLPNENHLSRAHIRLVWSGGVASSLVVVVVVVAVPFWISILLFTFSLLSGCAKVYYTVGRSLGRSRRGGIHHLHIHIFS